MGSTVEGGSTRYLWCSTMLGALLLLAKTGCLDAATEHPSVPRKVGSRTELPYCTREADYRHGEWVPDESQHPRPTYSINPDPMYNARCTQIQQNFTDGGVLPRALRYRWMPKTCFLAQFDKMAFCYSLNGQSVGVTGDSMQQSFVQSLIGMSTGRVTQEPQCSDGTPKICTSELCAGTPYSVVLNWLRLDRYPTADKQPEMHTELTALMKSSDYLVMNWGVHREEDEQMKLNMQELSDEIQRAWVPAHKPMKNVYWRATAVYSPGCDGPIGDAPLVSANASALPEDEKYHGETLLQQEEAIVWPAIHKMGATILHTDDFTNLRSDGHVVYGAAYLAGGPEHIDCLHYCLPGPTDHWVQLFYNYVIGLVRHKSHASIKTRMGTGH